MMLLKDERIRETMHWIAEDKGRFRCTSEDENSNILN
jgi:hypothetical protein